jgi:hypothetical protein
MKLQDLFKLKHLAVSLGIAVALMLAFYAIFNVLGEEAAVRIVMWPGLLLSGLSGYGGHDLLGLILYFFGSVVFYWALSSLFLGWLRNRRKSNNNSRMNREEMDRATAVYLKKLMPTCPVCNEAVDCHQFALMATTVIGDQEKPRTLQFFNHIKRHEWKELTQFKDWQATRDDLLAYSIACPGGGGAVVAIRSPFELYESDELFLQQVLTPEEQTAIFSLVPAGEWQPF